MVEEPLDAEAAQRADELVRTGPEAGNATATRVVRAEHLERGSRPLIALSVRSIEREPSVEAARPRTPIDVVAGLVGGSSSPSTGTSTVAAGRGRAARRAADERTAALIAGSRWKRALTSTDGGQSRGERESTSTSGTRPMTECRTSPQPVRAALPSRSRRRSARGGRRARLGVVATASPRGTRPVGRGLHAAGAARRRRPLASARARLARGGRLAQRRSPLGARTRRCRASARYARAISA